MQISGKYKPIKVFFHGQRLKDIYPFATRREMFKYRLMKFFRKLIIITTAGSILAGVAFGSFKIGSSSVTIPKASAEVVEAPADTIAPVLLRIMKCESDNHQYGKTGQVLMVANTNGSVDVGVMQINVSIWGAKAKELGYDLTKEGDNIAMGQWIYSNYGTEPWYLSAKCWNK